ncbi:MAG: phosphoribosyl-AMP cyclohydrolase [Deltaproteobacteria bacterium]|nr:phosphoribosyl-AMP cyclohydrolase [Deltaproteobacteria bacterium]
MLVPSIDLMDGKAVQLKHGREKVLERTDVIELAERFGRVGEIAVVDLDAAMGKGDNEALIREIVKHAACRVGGGIRTEDHARRLLRAGAHRVIIGTAASRDLLSRLPRHRVIVALDSIEGDVVTKGWTTRTGKTPVEQMQILAPYASGFLCTFVETEGTMRGISMERVRELRAATGLSLTVAGGVKDLDEVVALDREGVDVQVGMAIYTGAMDVSDAFVACMDFSKGLVPTVAQDPNGQVLMLAYSSAESLKQAIDTGRATYYSRSRDSIWVKGETSGNTQRLARVLTDCDRDALVFVVEQKGVACHKGTYTCFGGGGKRFNLGTLFDVITKRREDPQPGSYTSFLFEKDDRIPRKLNEEVYELLTAESHDDVVWEAADVMYFLLTYAAKRGVDLDEIIAELRGRER